MKLSPMMQQYLEIKKDYEDAILFFRLGDFYEMFFDDARLASKELELVLTGRDCGLDERAPMCGIPFHSADGYIARLVSKGYKVAICEQQENPADAVGIVKRDVIRVITPGTVMDSAMLDEGSNNYLCSLFAQDNEAGICFADVSTGEFHITAVSGDDVQSKIINQLSTYSPKEMLTNKNASAFKAVTKFADDRLGLNAQILDDVKFDFKVCQELIIEQFPPDAISSFEIGHSKAAVCALGALVDYLRNTQKSDVENVSDVDYYDEERFMKLDMSARRNLELTQTMRNGEKKHSLLWVLDKTKTPMGKRLLRGWVERPLTNISQITKRQNAIGEIFNEPVLMGELEESLSKINDIERLMTRIAYGTANAKELRALCSAIEVFPQLKKLLSTCNATMLINIHESIDLLRDVLNLIDSAIVEEPPFTIREGGMIKAGYNSEIDELKAIMQDGAGVIAKIELREKEKTGISKLKIGYNRVFGYYIEVSNSFKDKVPEDYIRKQTLANCERFITQELKELEGKILGAKEKSIALEGEVFSQVREKVAAQLDRFQKTANGIAQVDCLASLATVAVDNNYTCPRICANGVVSIKNGRHPVVEKLLDAPFVPNDTLLDNDANRVAIVTGPNMAGKSTFMRQTAIIVLMAQIGSFVPADSADISIVDAIFTRVGASDDLASGQSTFMVEMNEVANILKNATSNSLIVLDEIGRGTSTFDGMSIARAVLEFTAHKKTLGAKTLFATHYHELTVLEDMIDGVKNYSIAVKKRGDDITFLRKIVRGGADESFGIEVAKLAGVPKSVVKRAKVILNELENQSGEVKQKGFSPNVIVEDDEEQFTMENSSMDFVAEAIRAIDINTLTPIEALQKLYEIKKQLGD